MEAATATVPRRRRQWTCGGCRVTFRKESAELIERPAGWTDDGMCVACQRKAADKEGGQEGRLRWELLHGTPFRVAAKRSRMTVAAARGVRAGMVKRNELASLRKETTSPSSNGRNGSGPGKRKKKGKGVGVWSPRREEIEKALRGDPTRTDSQIAEEVGTSGKTVHRARIRLGLPPPPTHLELDAALLRELGPSVTTEQFAERIGTQTAGARRRLRNLADAGLTDVEVVADGQAHRNLYTASTAERATT